MSNTKTKRKMSLRWLVSAVMALTLMLAMALPALSVSAADNSTIDTTQTGTINIYKYVDSQELVASGTYRTQEELEALIQANSSNLEPLENVTFSYLKVGDVAQGTASDGKITIGYSITNSNLLNLLSNASTLDVAFTSGGTTYYTTTSLSTALSELTTNQMISFMSSNNGIEMTATNSSGYTSVSGLSLGLYLIVETGYPVTVTTTTAPFFVSLPMTDSSVDDGYEWIYEVTCYPKNYTSTISIDKSVVEDGNETKYIDGEIGQDKQFVIRADVPNSIALMNTYIITDTLSEGLTFQDDITPVVRATAADGTVTTLTAGTHYTFSQSGQTLTFTFDTTTLGTGGTAYYTQVEVSYYAYLNELAVVGSTGNANGAALTYSTKTSVSVAEDTTTTTNVSDANLPKVYTYAIDLTKYFDGSQSSDSTTNTSVTFELQDEDGDAIAVSYYDDGGYYYITGNTNTSNTNTVIRLGSDGTLKIHGLEAGTYYLVETATASSYNLLADKIEIIIESNEGTYSEDSDGTFAPYTSGASYYADSSLSTQFILPASVTAGKYVNFGTSTVYNSSATQIQMYSPNALTWSVTVGGELVVDTATSVSSGNGTFTITVNNQSGFSLPSTGGSGTFWFMAVGSAVALIAVVAIVVVTRKRREA